MSVEESQLLGSRGVTVRTRVRRSSSGSIRSDFLSTNKRKSVNKRLGCGKRSRELVNLISYLQRVNALTRLGVEVVHEMHDELQPQKGETAAREQWRGLADGTRRPPDERAIKLQFPSSIAVGSAFLEETRLGFSSKLMVLLMYGLIFRSSTQQLAYRNRSTRLPGKGRRCGSQDRHLCTLRR